MTLCGEKYLFSPLERASSKTCQMVHNARTDMSSLTVDIGDCVMIRKNAGKEHELQSRVRSPTRIVEAEPGLIFVVENLIHFKNTYQTRAKGRSVPRDRTSSVGVRRINAASWALWLEMSIDQKDESCKKYKEMHKTKIGWIWYDDDEEGTWEPIFDISKDMHADLKVYHHATGKQTWNVNSQIIFLRNTSYSWTL